MADAAAPKHTHHYAGFAYDVVCGRLTAQPGQHAAAYKEKHRRFRQDHRFATGRTPLRS